MRTRFIKPIGKMLVAGLGWRGPAACPGNTSDYHYVEHVALQGGPDVELGMTLEAAVEHLKGNVALICGQCQAPAPESAGAFTSIRTRYDTASGHPEPGDLYWSEFHYTDDISGLCYARFSGCGGKHLICVLPNGHEWDIDSRAGNCTRKEDALHRCWVRHGTPETGVIHVNKDGLTCAAGAGSIVSGNYHGFLHRGDLHLTNECTGSCTTPFP